MPYWDSGHNGLPPQPVLFRGIFSRLRTSNVAHWSKSVMQATHLEKITINNDSFFVAPSDCCQIAFLPTVWGPFLIS